VDFEELKDNSAEINRRKNRQTLLALFALFVVPVAVAYLAYFNGWFAGATKNFGELIAEENVVDIEDYEFKRQDGSVITGMEFETIYWWVMPIDERTCDLTCMELNLYVLNQTYIGLGKERTRINPLLVLPENSNILEQTKLKEFPHGFSQFSQIGVKALPNTRSGLNQDLPSNYIYLVDPLGNIFMRYPLVRDKEKGYEKSKDLRSDIKRLFKFSRLG